MTDTAVERGALVGLSVAPFSPTLSVGDALTFTVRGFYEDESSELLEGASWASADTRVLSIDSSGLGTAHAQGTTSVIATSGDLSARVQTTVRSAVDAPVSVSAEPSQARLRVGEAVTVLVTATFDDGTTGQVGGSCTWSTSDAAIATVDGGRIEAIRPGETRIEATCPGRSPSPVPVTVVAADTAVGQPDLRITFFEADVLADDVQYRVVITNGGQANAPGFWLDLFSDLPTAPTINDPISDLAWIPGLAASASLPVDLAVSGLSSGSLQSWVAVDLDDRVPESNNANNTAGPVAVTVSSARPDLTITNIDALSDGASTLYDVTVSNTGTTATGGFWIDLFTDPSSDPVVDDLGDDFEWVSSLSPGATAQVEFLIDDGPTSTWSSVLFADTNNDVDEADETNNLGRVTVVAE